MPGKGPMTIERVMRYLFSQEANYWGTRGYTAAAVKDICELTWWYHRGFALLSKIRKEAARCTR